MRFSIKIISSTYLPQTSKQRNNLPLAPNTVLQVKKKLCSWKIQLMDSVSICILQGTSRACMVQFVKFRLVTLFWKSVHSPCHPLLQTYSQVHQQHQYLGPPEHWWWIRETRSPLTNRCSLTLPAPVLGAQLHETLILVRALRCSLCSLKKTKKTSICCFHFNFFSR